MTDVSREQNSKIIQGNDVSNGIILVITSHHISDTYVAQTVLIYENLIAASQRHFQQVVLFSIKINLNIR